MQIFLVVVPRWRRQHFSLVINPWRERAAVVLHHLISIVQKHLSSKAQRNPKDCQNALTDCSAAAAPQNNPPPRSVLNFLHTYNRYRQDTNRSPDLVSRQPKRNFLYSVYDGTLVHIDFSVKSTPVVPPPPPPSPPPMCLRDTHKYTHTHAHTHISVLLEKRKEHSKKSFPRSFSFKKVPPAECAYTTATTLLFLSDI